MTNKEIKQKIHAKLDNLSIDELYDLLERIDHARHETDPDCDYLNFDNINEIHSRESIQDRLKYLMNEGCWITGYARALDRCADWYYDDTCREPDPIENTKAMLDICFDYWDDADLLAVLSFINKTNIKE